MAGEVNGIDRDQIVGFLMYQVADTWVMPIWRGVIAAARERGKNIFAFGSRLAWFSEAEANANLQIYSQLNASVGSLISTEFAIPWIMKRLASMRDRPCAWFAVESTDFPGVSVDNEGGMRSVLEHLIVTHGFRKLAFLRGPQEIADCEERYHAYLAALEEHHIPVDLNYVSPSMPFNLANGKRLMQILIEERGIECEAIVCPNDDFALAAVDYLWSRGYRVPHDIAVTGFDGKTETLSSKPPITTIQTPTYEMGKKAVEILEMQWQKKSPPHKTILSVELDPRMSCGCLSPLVKMAFPDEENSARKILPDLGVHVPESEDLARRLLSKIGEDCPLPHNPQWAENLWNAVLLDLKDNRHHALLASLNEQINQTDSDWTVWLHVIWAMQQLAMHAFSGYQRDTAEKLLLQGLFFVAEAIKQQQAREGIILAQQVSQIRTIGQRLASIFNIEELGKALAEELPTLGIPGCYIILYADEEWPHKKAQLKLAYDSQEGMRNLGSEDYFDPDRILPNGILSPSKQHNMLVWPLEYSAEQLGYIVFSVGPQNLLLYRTLTELIGVAVKGALLFQQRESVLHSLNDKQAELEKAYAEILNLSERDALTGLLNRRAIQREMTNEKRRMERYTSREHPVFSVLFIDLDNFKHYNDTFGHEVGDAALVVFADLVSKCIRITDMVSRFGGDEFLILLPETRIEGAVMLAERILAGIHNIDEIHARIGEHTKKIIKVEAEKQLTCSIGISMYQLEDDPDQVIRRADRALYQAKTTGRDKYCIWDNSME